MGRIKRRYDPNRIMDNLSEIHPGSWEEDPEDEDQAAHADTEKDEKGTDLSDMIGKGASENPEALDVPMLPSGRIREHILPVITQSINIAEVPPKTRFSVIKRLMQRALRIISLKQMDFNRETANAVAIWADHAEAMSEYLAHTMNHLRQQMASVEKNYAHLEARIREDGERRMRQMLHLFESQLEQKGPPPQKAEGKAPAPSESPVQSAAEDMAYVLYEDRWRGRPEDIRADQQRYLDMIVPILDELPPEKRKACDLGCGRGELVGLMKEAGIDAVGIDMNQAAIAQAHESGAPVEVGDAVAWLEKQPEASLGAITALQLVEHLSAPLLKRLIELAFSRLAHGGVAIFETLNPACFSAHRWYHMDLTHQHFIPPESLQFLCECSGFDPVDFEMIHPVAEHESLEQTGDDVMQENLRKINHLLFGCQDYYVLARKAKS